MSAYTCTEVSQHALEMFRDAAGVKPPAEAARASLLELATYGIQIGRRKIYADGWILAVRGGKVRSVYRPHTPAQFSEIHDAMKGWAK